MANKIKTINKARPELLTWLIAETCLEQANIEPTKEIVNWLVTFANYQFNNNELFKKGVLSRANNGCAGRDYLYTFIGHWVKAKSWIRHSLTEEMKQYEEELPEYKK